MVKWRESYRNQMLEGLDQETIIKTSFIHDILLAMALKGHILFYTEM